MVVGHNQKLRVVLSDNNTGTTGLAFLLIVSKDRPELLGAYVGNGYDGRHAVLYDAGYVIHIRRCGCCTGGRNGRICFT